MSFVNLSKLSEKYTTGLMKDNVENLVEFDYYHCLLAGGMSTSLKVQSILGSVPKQFLDWLKICDGGLLFDNCLTNAAMHSVGLARRGTARRLGKINLLGMSYSRYLLGLLKATVAFSHAFTDRGAGRLRLNRPI